MSHSPILSNNVATAAVPLVELVRGAMIENVHHGHLVINDGQQAVTELGAGATIIYPRSCVKPMQALAMLRNGLNLDGELLALACASHGGLAYHSAGVRQILTDHGLRVADLQNTPDHSLDAETRKLTISTAPQSITQNCSGKHAAMLATCKINGWPIENYLELQHPLQQQIKTVMTEFFGEPASITVDGCGAPLFSCTVSGLALGFARFAGAEPGSLEHKIYTAMSANPKWVGWQDNSITRAVVAVPGLLAKDGADAVRVAALGNWSIAVKILDGNENAAKVAFTAGLQQMLAAAKGEDFTDTTRAALAEIGAVPVLGHGKPVGQMRAVF